MSEKVVAENKAVFITYTVSEGVGNILERSDIPVGYVHGPKGPLHDKIAQALNGKTVGESVTVLLDPSEGFGEHDPSLTFTDDLENVPEQFRHIGAQVEMVNDAGETKTFVVANIENGKLTVDGNHPFAGKTVTFTVQVIDVREASEEEIASGQVISLPASGGNSVH